MMLFSLGKITIVITVLWSKRNKNPCCDRKNNKHQALHCTELFLINFLDNREHKVFCSLCTYPMYFVSNKKKKEGGDYFNFVYNGMLPY